MRAFFSIKIFLKKENIMRETFLKKIKRINKIKKDEVLWEGSNPAHITGSPVDSWAVILKYNKNNEGHECLLVQSDWREKEKEGDFSISGGFEWTFIRGEIEEGELPS